jgi:hypothetical protein
MADQIGQILAGIVDQEMAGSDKQVRDIRQIGGCGCPSAGAFDIEQGSSERHETPI